MKKIFNGWKLPLILFPIWVLVYVFIGPSFPYTQSFGKSRVLIHSKSAWQDKDWEKGRFLAERVFRDYGVRMAYHNKNGDVTIIIRS